MDLTGPTLALVGLILEHESVCLPEPLADAGAAGELVGAGLAVWWERPDGRQLVLTPIGRVRARAVIRERRRRATGTEPGPGGAPVTFGATAIELRWRPVSDPEDALFTRGEPEPPLLYGREVPLPYPDRLPAPARPGPRAYLDPESGEPLVLFGGVPVMIDPRLARRGARRPAAAARRGRRG